MTNSQEQRRAELEAAIRSDPGGAGFSALAELLRREGRLEEAERVVRNGLAAKPDRKDARTVLALILLDQSRGAEARRVLESLGSELLGVAGLPGGESPREAALAIAYDAGLDTELEEAFEEAETDAEQLITPNRVAEEALERVDAGAAEGLVDGGQRADALGPGSAFATASMADLLARQGDASGAERIRASLAPPSPTEEAASHGSGNEKTIATLERWLANLRGERS